jgi:hypothetical protein
MVEGAVGGAEAVFVGSETAVAVGDGVSVGAGSGVGVGWTTAGDGVLPDVRAVPGLHAANPTISDRSEIHAKRNVFMGSANEDFTIVAALAVL